jgi:tRNA (guanine37-N1)-methyltransferase
MIRVGVVTLFPELFHPFVETSFIKKAIDLELLRVDFENLRPHGLGKHLSVDDTPYGGGSGMVLRVDCVSAAMDALDERAGGPARRILMSPQGVPFTQRKAESWAQESNLMFICGRYEGFDERVRGLVHEEASLGDFIMTGGEVAAMAMLEATTRLMPGVLGNAHSVQEESFSSGGVGLEYPQYTRPYEFRGQVVPEVLRTGDHAKIAAWRDEQARQRTEQRRPDLLRPELPKPGTKRRDKE